MGGKTSVRDTNRFYIFDIFIHWMLLLVYKIILFNCLAKLKTYNLLFILEKTKI